MKTEKELQQLAATLSTLDLEDSEDMRRYIELVKPLSKPESVRLIAIHKQRAEEIAAGLR